MHPSTHARSAFELGLDLCAFLFLPVLVLASRGVAPLVGVAGLCALGLVWPGRVVAWRRVRGLALLLGALALWGLASSVWAIEPRRSLLIALRLAGMFAAGLALIAAADEIAAPRRLVRWLVAGFVLSLGLAAVQLVTRGALSAPFTTRGFAEPTLNNIEDGLGMLLLPLCAVLVLRGRRVAAALLAAVTVAMIFFLAGDAARIGFWLGVVAAVPLYFWRRPLVRLIAAGAVVLTLVAPLIFPPLAGIDPLAHAAHDYKFSAWHRLQIWSFVGNHIAERPLLGWGLDAARSIPGGDVPIPGGKPWQVFLPLHPHNAPLQLWLELGVPGAVLFALLAAWVWLALGAVGWPRLYTAAGGASLVTALIVGLGSYGVWQEWWVSTEFLTLFLILVMARLAAQPMPDTRTGSIS